MTPRDALIELLGRVGASQGAAVLVNDEGLNQWPAEAVKAMKSQRLIAKSRPAASTICPGCERNCAMPVHTLRAPGCTSSSFIVCDKRSDINRVPVSPARLNQWQCSADSVAGFVATILGLRRSDKQTTSASLWEIGIASGDKRSHMLCLQGNGVLNLVVGNSTVPVAELVEFNNGEYLLDGVMIRRMVDAATTVDPRYTPSDVNREAGKLKTQAMREGWQKAYRGLRKKRRDMSDVWYSQQIAKMGIAHGRDAETIRKYMKK